MKRKRVAKKCLKTCFEILRAKFTNIFESYEKKLRTHMAKKARK
jgi:hypothetical protein